MGVKFGKERSGAIGGGGGDNNNNNNNILLHQLQPEADVIQYM